MLESFNTKSEMQYHRLTSEEQKQRGILGRLVGVIASFKEPTRNGRRYMEELWDKTFNNPIMKEKLENRCIFGELGHPVDRTEIDMEKICICLAEMPKKGSDGNLYGVFDILDTPNGRILKTMCDYGCNIGVSSRGNGETYEEYDGIETVEPDSYDCECWDAVLLPACRAARPKYVTESYDYKNKTLKQALNEALEQSSESDRKVMEESLKYLDINYPDSLQEDVDTNIPNEENPVDEPIEEAAEDNGAELLENLQEALQKITDLETTVKQLQEELSVCYTKETRYSKVLTEVQSKITNLTNSNTQLHAVNEDLNSQVANLTTQVEDLNTQLHESQTSANQHKRKLAGMKVELTESVTSKNTLNEEYTKLVNSYNQLTQERSDKENTIKSLTENLTHLQNSYNTTVKQHDSKVQSLNEELSNSKNQIKLLQEELEECKKDSNIIKSQATAKITRSEKLLEKYKLIAKTAIDKYIDSRAARLGVRSEDIKSRLNENYSFNDIEKVCESLQQYKLNINALPFNPNQPVKMKITESTTKPIITTISKDRNVDDDVDETLRNFI